MQELTAACFDEYDVDAALLFAQCFKVTLLASLYVELLYVELLPQVAK